MIKKVVGKIGIIVNQKLESMIIITDISNFIINGNSAFILSGEEAIWKYTMESVWIIFH